VSTSRSCGGWKGGRLFTEEAALAIHHSSRGIPLSISKLSDLVLTAACERGCAQIDRDLVEEVSGESPSTQSQGDLFGNTDDDLLLEDRPHLRESKAGEGAAAGGAPEGTVRSAVPGKQVSDPKGRYNASQPMRAAEPVGESLKTHEPSREDVEPPSSATHATGASTPAPPSDRFAKSGRAPASASELDEILARELKAQAHELPSRHHIKWGVAAVACAALVGSAIYFFPGTLGLEASGDAPATRAITAADRPARSPAATAKEVAGRKVAAAAGTSIHVGPGKFEPGAFDAGSTASAAQAEPLSGSGKLAHAEATTVAADTNELAPAQEIAARTPESGRPSSHEVDPRLTIQEQLARALGAQNATDQQTPPAAPSVH
jgi:hypothetical protein